MCEDCVRLQEEVLILSEQLEFAADRIYDLEAEVDALYGQINVKS